MKWLVLIFAVVLAAIFLPMVSLSWLNHAQSRTAWTTRKVDTGEITVTASATGNVEPLFTMQVGSQASGRVKVVYVQPNDHIKAGQLLALLDSDVLEADRKDKEISVRQAGAVLDTLSVERDQIAFKEQRLKLNIEQAKVAVEGSEALVELAQKNLQRYVEMKRVSAATQTEVDIRTIEEKNTERDLKLKQIARQQLEVDLAELGAERKALEAKEKQAAIVVELAQQALARATMNLRYASISSPIDGVVLERSVDPGQTIFALQSSLFKIISGLNPIRILSQVDEAQVSRIHTGETVVFTVDAYQGEHFKGTVNSVRLKNEIRQNLVTYPVSIEAHNPPSKEYPDGKLRPGMTAYLTFEVARKVSVTRVPAAVLRFVPPEGANVHVEAKEPKNAGNERGMPATVYAPDGNSLRSIPIRVGDSNEDYFELVSGDVKPGMELVSASAAPPEEE